MDWIDAAKRGNFTVPMQILHGKLTSQDFVPSFKIAPIQ